MFGFYLVLITIGVFVVIGEDLQPQQQEKKPLVSQYCLGCICEALSGCNITKKCFGDYCGAFSLTKGYWIDGGQPTLNNESPESETAWPNCANNPYCAAMAVEGYMNRYKQDCNKDGRIDCDDFAAIHKFGGNGCEGQSLPLKLPQVYGDKYARCKEIVGNLD